jgi:hypothetical protein
LSLAVRVRVRVVVLSVFWTSFAMATVPDGPELSTVKLLLGPADRAWLPASSEAVPEAREIERVPSPARLLRVTVRVPVPEPETDVLPALALSVEVTVTLSVESETVEAPV